MVMESFFRSRFSRWNESALGLSGPALMSLVTEDLGDGRIDRASVIAYLESLDESGLQSVLSGSVDTSTHLKISLFSAAHRGLRVWLHAYKPWLDNEERYAASIHNHRYSFVSKILNGGYRECTWPVVGDRLENPTRNSYEVGAIVQIDSESVHSLEFVEPETMTFIVQLPTAKSFSVVYAHDGLSTSQLFDLEAKLDRLIGAWSTESRSSGPR